MKFFSKVTILILAVIFIVSCKSDSLPDDLPFDSAKWKSGDARTRGRMAYDLKRSNTSTGKTKAEIVELLGKPDKEREKNTWLLYEVNFGNSENLMISKIYLVVGFYDASGKSDPVIFTGGQLFGVFTIIPAKIIGK